MEIDYNDFYRAINVAKKSVATRTTLPILENVALFVDDSKLRLWATNLEHGVMVDVCDSVEDLGLALTVPYRQLSEWFGHMNKSKQIKVIYDDEKMTTRFSQSRSRANLRSMDYADMPICPKIDDGFELVAVVGVDEFSELVRFTSITTAKDESRPTLTTIRVAFDADENTALGASTDGFRLTELVVDAIDVEKTVEFLFPHHGANDVVRIAKLEGANSIKVYHKSHGNMLAVVVGKTTVFMSMIEGVFPNYTPVIPKEQNTFAIVNSSEFVKAAKSCDVFTRDSNNTIVLEIKESEINISGASSDTGDSKSTVGADVDGVTGEKVAVNCKYFLEFLAVLDTASMEICMKTKSDPLLIKSVGHNSLIHVIMPMHTGE